MSQAINVESERHPQTYAAKVYINEVMVKEDVPVYTKLTVNEFKAFFFGGLSAVQLEQLPNMSPSAYKVTLKFKGRADKTLDDNCFLHQYDEDLQEAKAIKLVSV